MLRRFLDLFRVALATAGRAAFARAAPLYFAILCAASIIFSPMGMRAADVLHFYNGSLIFRLIFLGMWLLATTPAARAVLCEPSLFFLRSLPIRRLQFFAVQGILLLGVESPFIALFLRGGGALAGLAACLVTMAGHTLIAARPRRALDWLAVAVLFFGVAWAPSPLLTIGAALCAVPVGFVTTWVRAPERDVGSTRALVFGPALLALTLAHALGLLRGQAALLLRFFLLSLLGAAIAALAIRNNHIVFAEMQATVTLGVLSGPLLFGACGLAGPVLRSDRQAAWLLEVSGASGGLRVVAAASAVAAFSALSGALFALLTGWLIGGPPTLLLRLAVEVAAQGALLAILACACTRWAQRGDKRDSDRVLMAMLGLILAAALLSWALHEGVLGAYALLAALLLDRDILRANFQGRWLRLRRQRQQEQQDQQGERL